MYSELHETKSRWPGSLRTFALILTGAIGASSLTSAFSGTDVIETIAKNGLADFLLTALFS